ncbi:hypothetical protein K7X08_007690 [Anisodus acutangulus]|uniref:Uncharacterized protein n=1 Tax=Anisodus acutangulus TaxID=402998 RepID=A0A9Q1LH05_9SOLA|nr:hypothetical protein K7X08_007690 [Anisodus acutangulus]
MQTSKPWMNMLPPPSLPDDRSRKKQCHSLNPAEQSPSMITILIISEGPSYMDVLDSQNPNDVNATLEDENYPYASDYAMTEVYSDDEADYSDSMNGDEVNPKVVFHDKKHSFTMEVG